VPQNRWPCRDASSPRRKCLQYLTFSLGDEVFAMDIRSVREIIQFSMP
jgi:chemotaxis signal transduction protein